MSRETHAEMLIKTLQELRNAESERETARLRRECKAHAERFIKAFRPELDDSERLGMDPTDYAIPKCQTLHAAAAARRPSPESEVHPMIERHPFHDLLPQHAASLRRRALQLACNEHRAEDLVQATLLKAWASRDSFRPETNLSAWLFTILRNTFFSEWRKLRREVEDVDGARAGALLEEPRQDHVLALEELMSALALLPHGQSRALVLTGFGFSQLETAAACRCTIGTIKSRVSRGRATLSRIVAQDEVARSNHVLRAKVTQRPTRPHRNEPVGVPMVASGGPC